MIVTWRANGTGGETPAPGNDGIGIKARRGRKSHGSKNAVNCAPTPAGSAEGATSDTLHAGDRVIVKYDKHSIGTITRPETLAVGYVEYRCDCHKQFRLTKREAVQKLRPRSTVTPRR